MGEGGQTQKTNRKQTSTIDPDFGKLLSLSRNLGGLDISEIPNTSGWLYLRMLYNVAQVCTYTPKNVNMYTYICLETAIYSHKVTHIYIYIYMLNKLCVHTHIYMHT